jgi:hypothetical protein
MSSENGKAPSAAHAEGQEQIEKQGHSTRDCVPYKAKSSRGLVRLRKGVRL